MYSRSCIYTHIYRCIHKYIRAYMHIYIYIYTHDQVEVERDENGSVDVVVEDQPDNVSVAGSTGTATIVATNVAEADPGMFPLYMCVCMFFSFFALFFSVLGPFLPLHVITVRVGCIQCMFIHVYEYTLTHPKHPHMINLNKNRR